MKNEIVSCKIEHHAVLLHYWQNAQSKNAVIRAAKQSLPA